MYNIEVIKQFNCIRFKISILRSHFCDCSDVYIVVKCKTDLVAAPANEDDESCIEK